MSLLNDLVNKSLPSLGTLKFLESKPVYAYANNQPTTQIIGYKYLCIAPEFNFVSVNVKVLGEEKLNNVKTPADVRFTNLEAVVYTNHNNRPDLSFRADNVELMKGG